MVILNKTPFSDCYLLGDFPAEAFPGPAPSSALLPKVIHRVWLGAGGPDAEAVRCGETWRKHHPGWQMRLWHAGNLPTLFNQDVYDSNPNFAHRTDILRLEILAQFGGVYVDCDMECLRPIDPLIQGRGPWAFVGAIQPEQGIANVETAIIGATPGHPLLVSAVHMLTPWAKSYLPSVGIIIRTGPYFFAHVLARWLQEWPDHQAGPAPVTVFPSETFYPRLARQVAPPASADALDHSYTIHHWDNGWVRLPGF